MLVFHNSFFYENVKHLENEVRLILRVYNNLFITKHIPITM